MRAAGPAVVREGPFALTPADREYLRRIGKPEVQLQSELARLTSGVRPIRLLRPCAPGDGIRRMDPARAGSLAVLFEREAARGRATKFVAASGAGSRMFRAHLAYRGIADLERRLRADAAKGSGAAAELLAFFEHLRDFPFVRELEEVLARRGLGLDELLARRALDSLLDAILEDWGLGYADIPKGLIPFHHYPDGARSAFEEHLLEAAGYLRDRSGRIRVHFTLRPRDAERVRNHLEEAVRRYRGPDNRYLVSLSLQDAASDTPALDEVGLPARRDGAPVLLRPAGHGALLENLQAIDGDIVFVRTIDNVLPERAWAALSFHRKVLAGLLIETCEGISRALARLERGASDRELLEIERRAGSELSLRWPASMAEWPPELRARYLRDRLDRPLRVCAMVGDVGETGGKPFWTVDAEGLESLQIVEAGQVDMGSATQRSLWDSAEYFNPADLVCSLRDRRGKPFDLSAFSDPEAFIVAEKYWDGRRIKVLELPGLWNGAMARWNTVFVEMPREIVSPVKSVLDLLKAAHRPGAAPRAACEFD